MSQSNLQQLALISSCITPIGYSRVDWFILLISKALDRYNFSYKLQVTSYKLQVTSYKLQVASYKLQAIPQLLSGLLVKWI